MKDFDINSTENIISDIMGKTNIDEPVKTEQNSSNNYTTMVYDLYDEILGESVKDIENTKDDGIININYIENDGTENKKSESETGDTEETDDGIEQFKIDDYLVQYYEEERMQKMKAETERDSKRQMDSALRKHIADEQRERDQSTDSARRENEQKAKMKSEPYFVNTTIAEKQKQLSYSKKAEKSAEPVVYYDKITARNFIVGQLIYEEGMKKFLHELKIIREKLRNTQSDKNNNFFPKESNPFGEIEYEGSEYYRNMTKALKDCIDKLEGGTALPQEINSSFIELKKRASIYYEKRKGMITGPWSKSGSKRLECANDLNKMVPVMRFSYDMMRGGVSMVNTGYDNKPYSEKSFSDVSNRANNFVEQHRMDSDVKRIKEGFYTMNNNPEALFGNIYSLASYKNKLQEKLAKNYKGIVESYDRSKPIDSYIPKNKNADIKTFAKRFAVVRYLDVLYRDNVTLEELAGLEQRINNGDVKRDIKGVYENQSFIREYKANRSKCFSRYKDLNNTDQRCKQLYERFSNMLKATVNYYGSLGSATVKDVTSQNPVISDHVIIEIMLAKVLTRPSGEVCLSKLEGYEPQNDMFRAMCRVIEKKLDGKVMNSGKTSEVIKKVNDIFRDDDLAETIINELQEIKDPKAILDNISADTKKKIDKKTEEKWEDIKLELEMEKLRKIALLNEDQDKIDKHWEEIKDSYEFNNMRNTLKGIGQRTQNRERSNTIETSSKKGNATNGKNTSGVKKDDVRRNSMG